ncbi:MAG TPA: hypothetical protein V6D07_18515 [Trichocoleus sp.]
MSNVVNLSDRRKQEDIQAPEPNYVEIGLEFMRKNKPRWAEAVIVAILKQDETDTGIDQFGHEEVKKVILCWSKHKRNLFSEMRKAADLYEETKHLGTGKGLFRVYEKRTQADNPGRLRVGEFCSRDEAIAFANKLLAEDKENERKLAAGEIKSYSPNFPDGYDITGTEGEIEHRDTYSGGRGMYLGTSTHGGWEVRKWVLDNEGGYTDKEVAEAIGRGNHNFGPKPKPTEGQPQAEGSLGDIEVSYRLNPEFNGIEVSFSDRPSDEVIQTLKRGHSFRWHKRKLFWYAKQSPARLAYVKSLCGESEGSETA